MMFIAINYQPLFIDAADKEKYYLSLLCNYKLSPSTTETKLHFHSVLIGALPFLT